MSNRASPSVALPKQETRSWISDGDGGLAPDPAPVDGGLDVDALYQEQASKLTRFLARRIGSREEARDLVQEAFSRLLGRRGTASGEVERPEAYLNRVTRNLLYDRAKTQSRRSAHLHVVADDELLPGPDQQRLLETRDMLRRLEAAMLKLKPKTREIFMAHRLDGMSSGAEFGPSGWMKSSAGRVSPSPASIVPSRPRMIWLPHASRRAPENGARSSRR